eukprot:3601894-Alexandrium_andersonii.AAC.1
MSSRCPHRRLLQSAARPSPGAARWRPRAARRDATTPETSATCRPPVGLICGARIPSKPEKEHAKAQQQK